VASLAKAGPTPRPIAEASNEKIAIEEAGFICLRPGKLIVI